MRVTVSASQGKMSMKFSAGLCATAEPVLPTGLSQMCLPLYGYDYGLDPMRSFASPTTGNHKKLYLPNLDCIRVINVSLGFDILVKIDENFEVPLLSFGGICRCGLLGKLLKLTTRTREIFFEWILCCENVLLKKYVEIGLSNWKLSWIFASLNLP